MADGKVNVEITGDAAGLIGAVGKATSSLKAMVGSFAGLGKSATASLSGIEKATGGLVSGLAKVGLAANGLKAIGSAAVSMGGGLLKGNANLEMITVSFKTLLGSTSAAADMIKQLTAFAAATPFELTGLESSTQNLLAFGFGAKEIIPLMTSMGDAISALGGTQANLDSLVHVMGQMRQEAHINAGDIMQMTNLGIPALQMLADHYHVTTGAMQEMVSKGLVPGTDAIKIFSDGMEKRYGGMMAAQSATFSGMISNLKDWATATTTILTKPLFEPAKAALKAFLDFVGSDAGKDAVTRLAAHIQTGVNTLLGVWRQAEDAFLSFKSALAGEWMDADKIQPLAALFGNLGLVVRNDIVPAFTTLKRSLGESGSSVGNLVTAFSPLSVALSVLRGFMVGGLQGAFDAFKIRVKTAEDALAGLANALGLSDAFNTLRGVIDPTIKSIFSLVTSISQIIEKSGAFKLAGDIASKAFQLIGEAVQFVDRIVRENIGPLSAFVQNFGNTVKAALDIAIAAFKALEEPVSAVIKFLSPIIPLLGYVAGAFVTAKVAMTGFNAVAALIPAATGPALLSLGKFALVLAPAAAAFEIAAKVVPGFSDTLDHLAFMATHVQETFHELYKEMNGTGGANPFVKQGSAIYDSTGKLIGYAKAFETLQQAQERVNKAVESGTSIFDKSSTSLLAWNLQTTFAYNLSYRYRDALTGLNDGLTKNGSIMQKLFEVHSNLITSTIKLTPPFAAAAQKANELSRAYDAATRAAGDLATKNDALQKNLSDAQTGISNMRLGIDQLALKAGATTIAFDKQNLTLDEATTKWSDLTTVQLAGGKGSYEAGVAAGALKDELVKTLGTGVLPFLDGTYKFIDAQGKSKTAIAENAVATQKQNEVTAVAAAKVKDQKDATAELTTILGRHGAALTTTAGNAGTLATQTGGATKRLGEYNTTTVNFKDFKSNVSTMSAQLLTLLGRLFTFNNTPIANKTGSITVNNVTTGSNGSYGPSLPPAPVQRPSQGQSTGLSGALDFGGAGARLSGTLTQAATQATQAAFSLTGLQAQIDQIIKMFNSLDQKALKAAVDQADAVSKIAGAAKSMVDAFTAMKGYTSVGVEVMKQVTADVVDFTRLYIAGATSFKPKALEGAATYIETSGKVADSAGKMVDTLGKLVKYTAIGKDIIWAFSQDVKSLVADFYNASLNFGKDMLPAADAFAATAGNVSDATSKGADALKKLLDWKGVATESIEGFTYNMRIAVANFYNVMKDNLLPFMLEGATLFADASGKVGEAIGKGADGLSKLLDWKGIATESIEGFVYNMRISVANFYNAMKDQFTPEMLEGAVQFAEAGGKVTSIIGAAVDGLKALKDYSGLNRDNMALFGSDLVEAVKDFVSAGKLFNTDGLTAATAFAEAAGKVTGVIKTAVDGLGALADYKSIVQDSLDRFMTDVITAVKAFGAASEGFKPEAVAATAIFADGVGKMTDGLGHAVSLFESLSKYKGVPQKTLKAFLDDVRETVRLAGLMAIEVGTSLMGQIDAFGKAIGQLFDGLSKAMTLFQGLDKYQSVPEKVIQDFINHIELTVNLAYKLAQKTDKDLLDKATAFADAIDKIFSKINSAITVFKGLQDLKDDPKNTIDVLIAAVDEAIKKMPQANSQAQDFYNNIDQWSTKMEDAARRAQAGLDAMNRALDITGTTPGGTTPAPWTGPGNDPNGPGGTGGMGFALGGLVQKSGVYTVGEYGPEQVVLPGGSRVIANNQSGRGQGGSVHLQGNVYITIAPPAGTNEQTIARMVQEALRTAPDKNRARQSAGYSPNRGV